MDGMCMDGMCMDGMCMDGSQRMNGFLMCRWNACGGCILRLHSKIYIRRPINYTLFVILRDLDGCVRKCYT
jgi:hypothetical protein